MIKKVNLCGKNVQKKSAKKGKEVKGQPLDQKDIKMSLSLNVYRFGHYQACAKQPPRLKIGVETLCYGVFAAASGTGNIARKRELSVYH